MNVYAHGTVPMDVSVEETVLHEIMTPQRPNDIRKVVLKTLKLQNKQETENMVYLNVLVPRSVFEEEQVQIKRISEGSVIGVEITGKDFEELFLYAQSEKIVYGDIKEDGRWMSIVKRNDNVVKKAIYKEGITYA